MKAKIYTYESGEQETIAEIELKAGKLVFSGPRAESIRAELSECGLLNIAGGKPSERVRFDNPELFMKNIPYFFSGSLCKAELVGRSPAMNRPTIKYTADPSLDLDGQLEVKIAWDDDRQLYNEHSNGSVRKESSPLV